MPLIGINTYTILLVYEYYSNYPCLLVGTDRNDFGGWLSGMSSQYLPILYGLLVLFGGLFWKDDTEIGSSINAMKPGLILVRFDFP